MEIGSFSKLLTVINCYALEIKKKQILKIVELVIEKLLRQQVDINDKRFGFMPGGGTIDATFILRHLLEKYLLKKKDLFFALVDLKKDFA